MLAFFLEIDVNKAIVYSFPILEWLLSLSIHVFLLQHKISNWIPIQVGGHCGRKDIFRYCLHPAVAPGQHVLACAGMAIFVCTHGGQVHVCLVLEIDVSEAFVMNFRYPNDCWIQDSPWKESGHCYTQNRVNARAFSKRLATEIHGFVSSAIIQVSEIDTRLLRWHEFRWTG